MGYFRTAILIFVVYVSPIYGQEIQEICPTGKQSTRLGCSNYNRCPLGSICYRKDDLGKFCCGEVDTFCPTKMFAINTKNSGSYLWEPSEITEDDEWMFDIRKKVWYNITLGNETIACPIPHSFTYIGFPEWTVLPVDFEVSETSKPKECKLNSDCHVDKDDFCGGSYHPAYPDELDKSGPNGVPYHFCYKSQTFGTNVKPIINPNERDLHICKNHSECFPDGGAQAFCFIISSRSTGIANDGNITYGDGHCSKAYVCDPEKHLSIVGSLSNNNSFCQANEDCEGSENAIQHSGMDPECVKVRNRTDVRICCSTKIKKCEVGKLERPIKTCSNFEDCNKDGNDTIMNKWCDEQSKHCCQDDENNLWRCPDGATPIFSEPKCEEFSPTNIESGKCSKDGGICRRGHCCPPLVRRNATEFSMGLKQYITNIACKSDEPVPEHFNYAFCDPDSMNIVILGTLTVDGKEIGTDGAKCVTNKECKKNEVCIKRMKDDRLCMWNPLKVYSKFWWYMLAASIVGALLFAGISVSFYITHRRKIGSDSPNLTAKTGTTPKTISKEETSGNKPYSPGPDSQVKNT